MSAYMLSEESLALLSKAIVGIFEADILNGSYIYLPEFEKNFLRKAAAKISGTLIFDKPAVFRLLQDMNARALQAQYGDDLSESRSDPPVKWPAASMMQVYKGLRSYLYQCAKGDVVKSQLYQTINSIKHAIGSAIIASLPEYEAAEWL